MRTTLLILAGMVLMYIILKYMSSKETSSDSDSWKAIKELLKSQQFNNLVKTNEFRELAKTSQFRNVVSTLAEDQIIQVSKTLIG